MGNILHVQQGDWQAIESGVKPVLVDFWAEWCMPCRILGPTFERLADNYEDEVTFAKVNVDELPDLANKYGIRSIPTVILLQQGNVVERLVGVRPQRELARILDRHVTLSGKK